MKPITGKAEVAVEFPNKAYVGSFGQHSMFSVHCDREALVVKLEHGGGDERRTAEVHFHYYLLAEILSDAAEALASRAGPDEAHREPLREAAARLAAALAPASAG